MRRFLILLIFFCSPLLAQKPNIYFLSIPKSGTFHFAEVLKKLSGKPNSTWGFHGPEMGVTHVQFEHFVPKAHQLLRKVHEDPNAICFFLIRELKDGICSAYHMAETRFGIVMMEKFYPQEHYFSCSTEEKVNIIMDHSRQIYHARRAEELIRLYKDDKKYFVVRYEDLIQPIHKNKAFLMQLTRRLKSQLNWQQVQGVMRSIGGNENFRKGVIGDHKNLFTKGNYEHFEKFRPLNEALGYQD